VKPETAAFLTQLNHQFYTTFGASFAATRRRVQDGVKRILDQLPDRPQDRWLDLGCGSGSVAAEWLTRPRVSQYLGVDFSEALLDEARSAIQSLPGSERVIFNTANLSTPEWPVGLQPGFSGIMSFAALHHIPSTDLRLQMLHQIHTLLKNNSPQDIRPLFIHSEWQFQNSPKLWARRLPWSTVNLDEREVEPGDYLLDWRFALPGQSETVGRRYVHLFTEEELSTLAQATGFTIRESFLSDGYDKTLGLYQIWEIK
jgi:tRNA (uracil-5-)-methyltransferase TRM9